MNIRIVTNASLPGEEIVIDQVTRFGVMSAFAKIRKHIPISSVYDCPALARHLGIQRALIKYEGSLPTGSFKVRGALNFAANVAAGTKLFTHSSGNWAQGIAYAACSFNIPVVVYMKPTASALKRKNTVSWGAVVRDIEGQPDQMTAHVLQAADQEGGVFVSPYDDLKIIEGHATCGVEIGHACKAMSIEPSDVVLPVSGGGLAAGVAFAVKSEFPNSTVTCVEPTGCDDFGKSLRCGQRTAIETPRKSIADGLLANQVGVNNWPVLQANVDNSVTVTDQDMVAAMQMLFTELGIIAEPSGAITVAAALGDKFKPKGQHAVFVVSGRNIETDAFLKLIGKPTTKKSARRAAPKKVAAT